MRACIFGVVFARSHAPTPLLSLDHSARPHVHSPIAKFRIETDRGLITVAAK